MSCSANFVVNTVDGIISDDNPVDRSIMSHSHFKSKLTQCNVCGLVNIGSVKGFLGVLAI